MKFLKEVLEEIQPSKEYKEEILSMVEDIISKINKRSKDVKAVLGGSGAKGTWLKTFDADIFVKFNYSKYKDKSDKLSGILERILKKDFKIIRLHGSRDYFQVKKKTFTFEIVPILSITKAEQAKNITDVSPLHARWVLKFKKLQNEIRLVKQFCKAQKVYGAESYINGFSGYVCEILTAYYGSFIKLVKNAAKWKEKEVADVKGYYKRKDIFRELNTSKLVSPLIIIDPVQDDRNASAALSEDNYNKFVKACKKFVKKPSKDYFKEKEFSIVEIKRKNKKKRTIFLEVKTLTGKKDVVGCKIVKALEFFHQQLKNNDFKIYEVGWDWSNKVIFYFILDKKMLTQTVEKQGPPLEIKNHVRIFKKKHKKTFTKKGKVYATEKRTYREPEKLLRKLLKDNYLKDKIKQVKFI